MLRPLLLLSSCFLAGMSSASIFYVSPSGSNANDGLAANRAKKTIQGAIGASVKGDEIRVQQGTYQENLVLSKGVTIKGGYRVGFTKRAPAGYPTIVDGRGLGPVIKVNELLTTQTATFDGLVIQNGTQGLFAWNANVILTNNTIQGNVCDALTDGAGFQIDGDKPRNSTITGNIIRNNISLDQIGGGFLNANGGNMVVSANSFVANESDIFIGAFLVMNGNLTMERNLSADNQSGGSGAGGYIYQANGTFRYNTLIRNIGAFASGIYVNGCQIDFTNNLVAKNTSSGFCGGLAFRSSNGKVNNNTFAYNRAEYDHPYPSAIVFFTNETITMTPEFANNIVAYNYRMGMNWNTPALVSVNYHNNCYGGNFSSDLANYDVSTGIVEQPYGPGDTNRLPLFMDAANDDFRLHPNSPGRDAGSNASASTLTTDLDQQPRIKGTTVDMGCYEAGPGGSLLFHDTYHTSTAGNETDLRGEDINFEYNLRQYGSLAPLQYVEDAQTAGTETPTFPWMTQVSNAGSDTLLLSCWPMNPVQARPNTSLALNKNFNGLADFEVSMELQPVYPLESNSSHWIGFSFGDTGRVTWPTDTDVRAGGPRISKGTGVTLQKNGTLRLYDAGAQVFVTNVAADFNVKTGTCPVKFRVRTNPAFDNTGTTNWTCYVAGRPVFSFTRNKGYLGNFITTAVYSDPAKQTVTVPIEAAAAGDLLWHWQVDAVDGTAPTATATPDRSPVSQGWYGDDVTMTLAATDEVGGSGIREVVFSTDGGATWERRSGASTAVQAYGQGTLTLLYYAIDNAGNKSPILAKTWKVDQTTTTCAVSLSPTPNGAGWNHGDVNATVTPASDSLSPQTTNYRIDGGATNLVSGPIPFLAEGKFVLEVWSVDAAGNVGPITTQNVWIDRTNPTVAWLAPTPAANAQGWNNTNVSQKYTAADALSGLASATPASPLTLSVEGNAVSGSVTVTDLAGNSAVLSSPPVKIDKTLPGATSVGLSGPLGDNGWYVGTVTVTLTGTDALSGILNTYYRVDGGGESTYTAPLALFASKTLTIRSADRAGNSETPFDRAIAIDTTKPTISSVTVTPTLLDNLGIGNFTDVDVVISASDVGSGMNTVLFTVTDVLGTCQPSGSLTLGGDGNYHATIPLEAYRTGASGRYTLSFTPKDLAGNLGTVRNRTVSVR